MMQAAITQIPTPEAQTLAYCLLSGLAGLAVPTRYGMERIEGFGRLAASKLPYKSPPGTDKETALIRATRGQPPAEDRDDQESATDADGGA
ncbi:hypothetical protein [Haloarcula salina]|uniref:hypothetical protein n=1 Tax=Haloarcula salina TaxID=1429914 RepID=UPI001F5042CF|nr:hypothetical protein [Haloarcula salina]